MSRILFTFLLSISFSFSQDYFIVNDGVKTKEHQYEAFTNGKIHTKSGIIDNGTLLIKDGEVISVGTNVNIPENTIVHNLNGSYVYPSFVELSSSFGIKKIPRSDFSRSSQYEPSRAGYYWNDHILSDYNSLNDFKYNKGDAKQLRDIGFGVVNTHNPDGVHRGTSIAVALIDNQNESYRIISQKVAEHFSFTRSLRSNQSYPSSVMGSIALIRQLYYDADWYSQGVANNKDLAIESLIENRELPKIFDANDKLNVLRAAKLSKELNLNFIIKGSGKEYENVREIKDFKNLLIIPINYPKAYDVSNPHLNKRLSINQLRYYNQAPANLSILEKNNINFSITSSDLPSKKLFLTNLRKAIKHGLSEKKAFESLTTIPAKAIGMGNKIGAIDKGYYANFLVTSGPIFHEETIIYENWVKGQKHLINDRKIVNIDGSYNLNVNERDYKISFNGSQKKISASVLRDSIKINSKISYKDNWLYLTIFDKINDKTSFAQLSSKVNAKSELLLTGSDFEGNDFSSKMTFISKNVKNKKKSPKESNVEISPITYPNIGYGLKSAPIQENIHFYNATLWTNEEEGIINNSDIIVSNGEIIKIGQNLKTPSSFKRIDASNKHITSGIIDEHSHMGASSINEGGHNSSAEVSIMDVINPDDINLYRNLAGGVTTVQILHGSANPIGGQSAIIKLKWGSKINEMFFPNADPFIKFALGENVKQSNWGGSRFPQTRMGVEQVFIDHFDRAKDYGNKWEKYNSLSKREKARAVKPRYDEEMETLWEIIKGERFVTSHSYVQSEINMLMKVAEKFDFRINTFTHILEGYKVSDKMFEHGAGASTFSDWWGYKYEVNDAIPYNAAIMHNVGVTVAFNSDSSELSRRLNLEAAKAVKYGGVSEEEAWKFVTLNPAKLLHLDDKVGSLKVGKNADIVVWSGHPMSIYTKAEKTMIDGAFYFDTKTHQNKNKEIKKEKEYLIKKMLNENKSGGDSSNAGTFRRPTIEIQKEFNCETID